MVDKIERMEFELETKDKVCIGLICGKDWKIMRV